MEIFFALVIGFLLGVNVVLCWIGAIPRFSAVMFTLILAVVFFFMGNIVSFVGLQ